MWRRRAVLTALALVGACGRFGFDAQIDAAVVDGTLSDVEPPSDFTLRCPMDNDPSIGGPDCIGAGAQTCIACPTPVNGVLAGGYSFSANKTFDVGPSTLVGPTYTISIWVNPNPSARNMAFIAKPAGLTSIYNVVSLSVITDGNLWFETSPAGTSYEYTTTTNVDVRGAWHHVAATWDGTTKQLFVDGVFRNASATTSITSTELVTVGCDIDNGVPTLYYDGQADELRIYPRVLSAAEIAALAQ